MEKRLPGCDAHKLHRVSVQVLIIKIKHHVHGVYDELIL
jgi:hypothetical protein